MSDFSCARQRVVYRQLCTGRGTLVVLECARWEAGHVFLEIEDASICVIADVVCGVSTFGTKFVGGVLLKTYLHALPGLGPR